MDFVQERYIKDKYIGDMDLIKDLGDGRIAPAISQLNIFLKNNISVRYIDTDVEKDPKFANYDDYVVSINKNGLVKPIMKMGYKTLIILKDGILDTYFMKNLINAFQTTFALTSGGLLSWTVPNSENQYFVCCLPIDVSKYNRVKFTFSKSTQATSVGVTDVYPSVIYISTSRVNETKPYDFYNSFPNPNYNVLSTGGARYGEFDISSYSGTIYLCFGSQGWRTNSGTYYPSTFSLHYLELT